MAALESTLEKNAGKVIVAPLVARQCAGNTVPVYHIDARNLETSQPADLVFVDGPPLALGGRLGVLYQAMDFARPGTIILLDDADRKEEKKHIAFWQTCLGDAIEVQTLPGYERGLAACIVNEPVPFNKVDGHRMEITARDLISVVPSNATIILVDDEQWTGSKIASVRRTIPFLEHDDIYHGPPPNDDTAIQELEQMRAAGADYIVFGWPTFWWLDYYANFHEHLRANFPCLLNNGRLVIWDLR